MRPEESIRVSRINRVLNEFVRPRRRGPSVPLEVAAYHVHGEPVPASEALAAEYAPFLVGGSWGPPWDTTWFRLRGRIPTAWSGREVALGFGIGNAGSTGFGAEALLWRDGRPAQGLSPNHREHLLTTSAAGGEDIELFVEAAANPPSPFGANPWPMLLPEPQGAPLFTLQQADLHVRDPEFEEFWHDFRVLVELLGEIRSRWTIPDARILGHSDVAPRRKEDPGELFPWEGLAEAGHGLWFRARPAPGPSLKAGEEGAAVLALQSGLARLGYDLAASGRYDEATLAVVRAFQRHWAPGRIDGLADGHARAMLLALLKISP